jgi:fumarate hydratase, class I
VQRYLSSAPAVAPFQYQELFDVSHDNTPYRKVTDKYVKVIEADGMKFLKVEPEALTLLASEAMVRRAPY